MSLVVLSLEGDVTRNSNLQINSDCEIRMGGRQKRIYIEKHGLDFEDAGEVFDNLMFVALDTRQDYGEDRWIGLGLLQHRVAVVIYTYRDSDRVRIISISQCERRCNMKDSNAKSSSATDWERIDKLTDEQIDTSDIPPLDADFFSRATWQMAGKSTVVLNVDADVLEWFQAQGEKSKERMNAALRIYAEAHKRAA